MVIIKKFLHTQRQVVKGKKAFVSVLAVVLSLLITISVVFVAVPTVAAKGESPFQDNECIYIDCSKLLSGNKYWDSDGAALRVFTFYNDSNDKYSCHEYQGNHTDYKWYTGATVLQAGIKADHFNGHIYRFRIPANNLSHLRIIRTNGSSSEHWTDGPEMWNKDRSSRTLNCIKITDWDKSGTWTTFTPSNNASSSSKTASLDSSITGRNDLFTIDAKYYDYYNDDEIQKGWQNINYTSNHGSVHYTRDQNNNWTSNWYWWDGYWEPFSYLNSKIAAHDSEVNYPLYFGNFYGKADGYTGEGASNMTHYNKMANNSQTIGGEHKSVAGLTGGTLDSNGNLVYATNNGYNSSTTVPFFDDNFLIDKKVGSVIKSKFPMKMVVDPNTGITNYKFDSTNAAQNVWIEDSTGDSPSVHYGEGETNGAKDSLYSYSDRETSGYGFFPFDSTRGTDADAKNYGFGMRVDVKFNLGADSSDTLGQIKGTDNNYHDQVFSFTGDDDVWVYVDGKLILDLGGDHKKATGTINFHEGSVSVNTGHTFNNATRNQDFTLSGDATTEHTLTMFYVERGMIESNLSFNFNFAPVGNEFIVDKTVNTTKLNTGIQSAVAAADTFTFTQPTAAGKVSSKGTIGSDGDYTLKDGERISFKDQFTRGQEFTVEETESSPLDYTTTWSAKDLVMNESIGSGNSKEANFTYNTSNTSEFAMTRVQLSYVNTPTKANAVISKNVVDSNDNDVTDNKSFPATVYLSFDQGATYNTYPLTYTVTGSTAASTMSNGQVTLQEGNDITIPDLPVGTYVKVVESASGLNGYTNTSGDVVFEVNSNGTTTTITNKQPAPGEVDATIEGTKYLDNQLYRNGTLFEYNLKGVAKFSGDGSNVKDTSAVDYTIIPTNAYGKFVFSGASYDLQYSEPGIYRYIVTEGSTIHSDHDGKDFKQIEDTANGKYAKFLVTITVSKNASNNTLSAVTKTVPIATDATVTAASFNGTASPIVFYNEQQKGSVTVYKTDQKDTAVSGVTFGIFKVTNDQVIDLDAMSTEEQYDYIKALDSLTTAVTNSNGVAEFNNLAIFEEDSYATYQNYRIIELSGPTGYNINKSVMEVLFPEKKGATWSYDLEFRYINGKAVNPNTGYISPIATIRTIGIALMAAAVIFGAIYLFRKKKVHVRYKRKH